jgi:hypothetical protein
MNIGVIGTGNIGEVISFHPPGDAHRHYGQSSIFTFMVEIYMAAGISD